MRKRQGQIYKALANAVGVSVASLKEDLASLGMEQVASDAARLRFREQFGTGQKGLPDTTPTLEHLKSAFVALCRNDEREDSGVGSQRLNIQDFTTPSQKFDQKQFWDEDEDAGMSKILDQSKR